MPTLRGAVDLQASFIDREVRPVEERHRQEIHETGTFEAHKDERAKLRKRSAELGFFGRSTCPRRSAAAACRTSDRCCCTRRRRRHGLLLAQFESIFPVVTGPTPIYMDCTRGAAREVPGPADAADKTVTCFALTEPGAGSDATRIQTKAVRADGGWVLNGRKHFITGGEQADFALVFAVTDAGEARPGRHHRVLRGRGHARYDGDPAAATMSPFQNPAELTFEDVRVPDDAGARPGGVRVLLGGARDQRRAAADRGRRARASPQNLLDRSLEYAKTRVAFERPIGTNQFVQGMLVDSYAELEQARLLVYQCARRDRRRRRRPAPGRAGQAGRHRDGRAASPTAASRSTAGTGS